MNFKLCEIVQQADKIDINKALKVLNETNAIQDYAYILHDKDIKDNVNVTPHYHICIRFKDSTALKQISTWFDVSEQYINRVKGRWSDMLKYLTHKNRPDKWQYDDSEVVSNFDWQNARDNGSDTIKKRIIDGIISGEIREYNYFKYITPFEYDKYKRTIDATYKYRADMLKGVNRDMDCIFITGLSGSGKTTYAKDLAFKKNYSVFVSSGSNDVLDGYMGEDCIILDDLRPSCLGLSDLLKMLDNNTSSTVKSRYRNKVLECKLIIITTVLPLETFYSNVFENEGEPIVQFKRRCKTHIYMDKKWIKVSVYNSSIFDYTYLLTCDNPMRHFNDSDFTTDSALDYVKSMLGDDLENVKVSNGDGEWSGEQINLPFD